jgi:hypothetical protein
MQGGEERRTVGACGQDTLKNRQLPKKVKHFWQDLFLAKPS